MPLSFVIFGARCPGSVLRTNRIRIEDCGDGRHVSHAGLTVNENWPRFLKSKNPKDLQRENFSPTETGNSETTPTSTRRLSSPLLLYRGFHCLLDTRWLDRSPKVRNRNPIFSKSSLFTQGDNERVWGIRESRSERGSVEGQIENK